MPVSDVWGATIDRTVSGKITLTLVDGSRPDRLPVTVTVPWDGTKATKSDLRAAFEAVNTALGPWEIITGDLWDHRCQYARFAFKVMDYADAITALPGNQRAPWTAKRNRIIVFRDQFKALAGE